MEPRGNAKLNFRELARRLDVSFSTLYRVINNSPYVKESTKARVIEALYQHGYFTGSKAKNVSILFDFTEHRYLTYYGHQLMQMLRKLRYNCVETDHRKDFVDFSRKACACSVAVMMSVPDDAFIERMRRMNPDLYIIALSTHCNADVTIAPDHAHGGEIAARHFVENGHRHIAVHLSRRHPNRYLRYCSFLGNMEFLSPGCRIDPINEEEGETTVSAVRHYLETTDTLPTALLFLAGEYAEEYYQEFLPDAERKYRELSVLSFDNPDDLEFCHLHYTFDRIEYRSRDLLNWAAYYITNRPLMKKRSCIRTAIDVKLVVTGSVKNLNA